MKKLLPKGFTLIELLVTISIIAILAVIGVSVYINAQGTARDGRRRAEVTQIAKSIEASKDPSTGIYSYASTDLAKDFPQNTPTDTGYCYMAITAAATDGSLVPNVPISATVTTGTCYPVASMCKSEAVCSPLSGNMTTIIGNALPASTKGWILCATLERSTTPYCVKSLTP